MKRALFPLGVLTLAALLAVALVHLFRLRFEQGDVYPPSSTLRADPLGVKALYDALRESPGYEVRRNFQPLTKRRPGPPLTLIYAGIQRKSLWGEDEIKTFETLITHGSRAVFAFAPEQRDHAAFSPPAPARPRTKKAPTTPPPGDDPAPPPSADEPSANPDVFDLGGITFADALHRWDAGFALPAAKGAADRRALAAPDAPDLEAEISWHSALYFKDLSDAWRTLYTCEGKPVIIERPFGDGTIILAADAYFLSNEALRRERHPRLLAWLLGPPGTAIFDEEHLGISEQANLASLVGKYRLHGVVAGLILIGALALWKAAVPLVPKRRNVAEDVAEVRGKDAESGFNHLLRRSIPPARLIEVCVEEWEKTGAHRATDAELTHVRAVVNSLRTRKGKDVLAAYRTIAEGLATRGGRPRLSASEQLQEPVDHQP